MPSTNLESKLQVASNFLLQSPPGEGQWATLWAFTTASIPFPTHQYHSLLSCVCPLLSSGFSLSALASWAPRQILTLTGTLHRQHYSQ